MARSRSIALLGSINVGGRNKLPMKELVSIFVDCGACEVETLIQSGNVVFAADARLEKTLAATVTKRIEDEFGFSAPVILRKAAELRRALDESPYRVRGVPEDELHVFFLGARPAAAKIETMEPSPSPPDAYELVERDVHLHLPGGAAKTKLTKAWLERRLGVVGTARNLRTCMRILELAERG